MTSTQLTLVSHAHLSLSLSVLSRVISLCAGFTGDKLMQKMRYDMTAEDFIDIDVHTCVYAGEVLFENDGDEGEASIAAAVLDSLSRSPIDARCQLAQNIRMRILPPSPACVTLVIIVCCLAHAITHCPVVIGGTGRIPGFRRRLLNEIHKLVASEPDYATLKALADQFCVIDPAFPPHYLSWLGGTPSPRLSLSLLLRACSLLCDTQRS
jgi:hypothetical protein